MHKLDRLTEVQYNDVNTQCTNLTDSLRFNTMTSTHNTQTWPTHWGSIQWRQHTMHKLDRLTEVQYNDVNTQCTNLTDSLRFNTMTSTHNAQTWPTHWGSIQWRQHTMHKLDRLTEVQYNDVNTQCTNLTDSLRFNTMTSTHNTQTWPTHWGSIQWRQHTMHKLDRLTEVQYNDVNTQYTNLTDSLRFNTMTSTHNTQTWPTHWGSIQWRQHTMHKLDRLTEVQYNDVNTQCTNLTDSLRFNTMTSTHNAQTWPTHWGSIQWRQHTMHKLDRLTEVQYNDVNTQCTNLTDSLRFNTMTSTHNAQTWPTHWGSIQWRQHTMHKLDRLTEVQYNDVNTQCTNLTDSLRFNTMTSTHNAQTWPTHWGSIQWRQHTMHKLDRLTEVQYNDVNTQCTNLTDSLRFNTMTSTHNAQTWPTHWGSIQWRQHTMHKLDRLTEVQYNDVNTQCTNSTDSLRFNTMTSTHNAQTWPTHWGSIQWRQHTMHKLDRLTEVQYNDVNTQCTNLTDSLRFNTMTSTHNAQTWPTHWGSIQWRQHTMHKLDRLTEVQYNDVNTQCPNVTDSLRFNTMTSTHNAQTWPTHWGSIQWRQHTMHKLDRLTEVQYNDVNTQCTNLTDSLRFNTMTSTHNAQK